MELKLKGISKAYGKKLAVDDFSVTLTQGVYGLLGANGAGKSTLMRIICDIMRPTRGEILLDGCSIKELGEDYRNLLGYLPQDFGYYPSFSGEKFLLYMASLKGMDRKSARARGEELLELVRLSQVKNKKISSYSGGMKQRLGIAQALLNDPKILVLDEPTAGLDPKERVRFRNLISSISRDKIVLLSTHIVSDVEYISKEILIMKDGKLLKKGSPEEIVQSIQGKVWEMSVPAKKAMELTEKFNVDNLRNEGGMVVLRIISSHCPGEGARQGVPNLEDLYLHCFSEKE